MQNNDGSPKKENQWIADRSAGLLILLISCGAAVISIVWPLMGMFKQSEDVIFSTNMIAINIVGILFGLAYSILGGEYLNNLINPTDKKGTVRLIIFSVVLLAILAGLILAWSSLVSALGYG
jgi:hypothetical protein